MVWYVVSCLYSFCLRCLFYVSQKQNFAKITKTFFKNYSIFLISSLILFLCFAPQAALAQIGVGFIDDGLYQGTIGSNKGDAEPYRCPWGSVSRGYLHSDLSMSAPRDSTRGMTGQISIYCTMISLDANNIPRTYPLTPDGTPTVTGYRYPYAAIDQTAYCPANQIVSRFSGYYRYTTLLWPWASAIAGVCRPLKAGDRDWVEIVDDATSYTIINAGNRESNAIHSQTSWFCPISKYAAVSGIYRQAGGEGYDGINVYCSTIQQARLSARLEFQNFAWDKTLGTNGWLVNLTQNGEVLERNGISGRDKLPYSSSVSKDNDPNKFDYDREIYVLPGSGYGANLSRKPENIPEQSYIAASNCLSLIILANREDKSCNLYILGRPDIGVSINIPDNIFTDIGSKKNVTITATNYGATYVRNDAGFILEVTLPQGWTPEAVPGCISYGQKLACAITQNLAEAASFGQAGGAVSFTFPITANSNAQLGNFDVLLKLDRTLPDISGLAENSDFRIENDTAQGTVSFTKRPILNLVKTSIDGIDQFTFTENNGGLTQILQTEAPGIEEKGAPLILANPRKQTIITEKAPENTGSPAYGWIFKGAECTGLGKDGTYSVNKEAYTVTLDENATDYNTNITCKFTNQFYTTRTTKKSNIANNTPVQSDDEIIYTLSTQVIGDTTKKNTVLTDTLGDSLDYIGIVNAGEFIVDSSAAPKLQFTLPQGKNIGTYEVSYKVKVRKDADKAVKNAVTSNNGYCNACTTQNPLIQISTVKKSDIGIGSNVSAGDIITYTLLTKIAGGISVTPIILTDSLSDNLEFVDVVNPGAFQIILDNPQKPQFILAKITASGSYEVKYRARVKAGAEGTITNNVIANSGLCNQCGISNNIVSVHVNKSSDIGIGGQVQNGDIITYKITAAVIGGTSVQDTVLTDTLSDGLTFQSIDSNTRFTVDTSAAPKLKFTLAKGMPPGIYTITYKAKATNTLQGNISNKVEVTNAICETCITQNPITRLLTSKTCSPASGKNVQIGDIIFYTATVRVTDGQTTNPVILTDTLGSGLTFDGIENAGQFTFSVGVASELIFTLPKGIVPGDYSIVYRAKVKAAIEGGIKNNIIPNIGTCGICSTQNPVTTITTDKSTNLAPGQGVQQGDTITYILTATVKGGATTNPLVLSDHLGQGLSFSGIVDAGSFTPETGSNPLKFTLPKGTGPGIYTVKYTVKVGTDATNAVENEVTPSHGTTTNNKTKTPLVTLSTVKNSAPANGTALQRGDTIIYTLTTTVKGGATTQDTVLTDTLSQGLSFTGVEQKGDFKDPEISGQNLVFTLPKGAKEGSHSVSYKVTISANATDKIGNSVVPNNGDCPQCTTQNNLVNISTAKTADTGDKAVQISDNITYTLTATVKGGATTQDLVLTDTLSEGLQFDHLVNAGKFQADTSAAPVLKFTLPKNAAAATYTVSYMVKVTATNKDQIANNVTSSYGSCETCSVKSPISKSDTVKTVAPQNGTAVQKGDILNYTLTTTISGGTSTQALTISDTLGTGLEFVEITDAGDFTPDTGSAPKLNFTLPKGKGVGTYSVKYRVKVTKDAVNSVENKAVSDKGQCSACSVQNPLVGINTVKTVNNSGGVEPGDTLVYTLKTTVTAGQTTQNLVLTDNLGDNLEFGGLEGQSPFTLDASNPKQPKFTLAAGQSPGTYTVSYRSKIKAGTSGAVKNNVTADNGTCDSCSVTNPLVTYATSKINNSTKTAQIGDEITYTIMTKISGGVSTQPLVLKDQLGQGMSFINVVDKGQFEVDESDPKTPVFTLPAGKNEGNYTISYKVRVGTDTPGIAENSVIADKGTCDSCQVISPLLTIATAKASSPPSGTAVQRGDLITYTLTVNIVGGVSTQNIILNDTLNDSLEPTNDINLGDFQNTGTNPQTPQFTLPAEAKEGTHSVTYVARVKDDATLGAANSVKVQSQPVSGDPIDLPCNACSTDSPLIHIATEKTASPSGSVQSGDTITYTLKVSVSGGSTTKDTILTDKLGTSLQFVAVTENIDFKVNTGSSPELKFTLPKGAAAGEHTIKYTAKVKDQATEDAANAASADNGSCNSCSTTNPLTKITTAKMASPPSGTAILPGDLITYTLSVTVENGPSTQAVLLTDILNDNLEFNEIFDNQGFTIDIEDPKNLKFTLPKGKEVGIYTLSYTARVKAGATSGAENKIVPQAVDDTGTPIEGNNLLCTPCTTQNPLLGISISKSATPAGAVQKGDKITYKLQIIVAGGKTTRDIILKDTFGDGLENAAIEDAGIFRPDFTDPKKPNFTLPADTPAGTYYVTYSATVANTAGQSVKNAVVSDTGTCDSCSVENPISTTSTTKSSDVGNGSYVQRGDTITYTLTTIVKDGATTQETVLTDSLGGGLQFMNIVKQGAYNSDISNKQQPKFILPKGTPEGTYSISYSARVTENATDNIKNTVTSNGGDCDPCATENPPVEISSKKTASPASGTAMQKSDIITYTLAITVSGGKTTKPTVLTDALGTGLQFKEITNSGKFTADTSNPQALTFTLPKNTEPGVYETSFTAEITDDKGQAVKNTLIANNGSCNDCTIIHPLSHISTEKSSDKGNLAVKSGDLITYKLTVTVKDNTTTRPITLSDEITDEVNFEAVSSNPDDFIENPVEGKVHSFTLPAGKDPGTYSLFFIVRVKDDLPDNTIIKNAITTDSGSCDKCETSNPLYGINSGKTSELGDDLPVERGQAITYTINTTVTGGPIQEDYILTDILGESLEDFTLVNNSPEYQIGTPEGQEIQLTLPKNTPPGTYTVIFTAKVKIDAEKSAENKIEVPDGRCDPCGTKNTVIGVEVNKSVNVGNGTAVQKGDILNYTLTASVTGGDIQEEKVLTDILGDGLEFVAIVDKGEFLVDTSAAPKLTFTLPQGTKVDKTYPITYQVRVKNDAADSVGNKVTPPSNTTCDHCETTNPLIQINAQKGSNNTGPVQSGDVITYSLSVDVKGGITTQDTILTDDLGANLRFDAVVSAGSFTFDATEHGKPRFILPAGTQPGTYTVSYNAIVQDEISGPIKNSVVAQPGKDNIPTEGEYFPCDPCSITNGQIELTNKKTSAPPSGTAIQAGDIITYTLSTTAEGGTTTQDVVLTDNLGRGVEFIGVDGGSDFIADTTSAPTLKFTLPKGANAGEHIVSYRVKVGQDNQLNIRNNVITDSGICEECSTNHLITKTSVTKKSTPPNGTAVQAGDTITYILTATIEDGISSQAVLLTDTLGESLEFVEVTNAGQFTADTSDKQNLKFTLPKEKAEGSYTVSYTARVKKDAATGANNSVTAKPVDDSGTPIDGGNIPCTPCTTQNPLATITTNKSSAPANNTAVSKGDIITYTLTAEIANGANSQALLLTDTLGESLEFVAVKNAGAFTADTSDKQNLKFTLPKGKAAGTYTVSYTARVKTDATVSAENNVVPKPLDDSGTPIDGIDMPCPSCSTENPLILISTSKTANPASGAAIQKGDLITYTLTANVEGGTATQATLLTDTLGNGLEFVEVINAGDFTADISDPNVPQFTLPKGASIGEHSVSYKVRATANATISVKNSVVPKPLDNTGTPINGVDMPCNPCQTENPLIGVSAAKTSDPANGHAVQAGDVVTYMLTVNITGSASTQATLLTDSLGDGLEFIEVKNAGSFIADTSNPQTLKFTLPKGQAEGSYTVSYTARVKKDSTIGANNSVTAKPVDDGGTPIEDGNVPCTPCTTQNPLATIHASKTSAPSSGTTVQIGDLITYTLSAEVKGGMSSQAALLTDALGESLEFVEVTNAGQFTTDTSDKQNLKFTLPKGKAEGTYTVSYTAHVKKDATIAANNNVTAKSVDGSGTPIEDGNLPCDPCTTQNPLVGISSAKAAEPASGTAVQIGDLITYTLTISVRDGATTQANQLTDKLNESLEFVAVKNAGAFTPNITDKQNPKFTLPKGTATGTYTVSYTARVKAGATTDADNEIITQPVDDTGTPIDGVTIPCEPCRTNHPLIGISTAKKSNVGDGTFVQKGDLITYTLTTNVKGGVATQATLLTDSLNDSLEFVAIKNAGDFTAQTSNPKNLTFLLAKGASIGEHNVSYIVRVKKDATITAENNVKAQSANDDGSVPPESPLLPCDPCTTQNPLSVTSAAKSSDVGNGTAVQQGDIITYTLTVDVQNGATSQATLLTDSLNASLEFVETVPSDGWITDESGKPLLKFLLLSGAAPGKHTISYKVRVKTDALTDAQNSVKATPAEDDGSPLKDKDGNPIPEEDWPKITCDPCETQNPLTNISTAKTSDIGNSNSLQIGELITYTLTVEVKNGGTTQNIRLTDNLGDGLEFVAVINADHFEQDISDKKHLKFTLPKDMAEGTYTVVYSARVTKEAQTSVRNTLMPQAVDDSGTPIENVNIPCTPCETQNPISLVSVNKTSDIGNQTAVQKGDAITYTLTVNVQDNALTTKILLTDSLNDSLVFDKVTDLGQFTADITAAPKLLFTLPKNMAPGTYSVSYMARVKTDAELAAKNEVVPQALDDSGIPIEGIYVPCQTCSLENPLISIKVAKSSDIGDHKPVQQSDMITYTLAVTVSGGTTTQATLLTDKLGISLNYIKISDAGGFIVDDKEAPLLKFLLPAGATVGEHQLSYQVQVKSDAQNTAYNNVIAQAADKDGNPIDGPKIPCAPCSLENPLINISAAKSSDIGTGTAVQQGDIIIYTLTATVNGGATTQATLLTDTLGTSLEFVSIEDAGDFKVDQSALPALKFLLPAGAAIGDHKAIYKLRVKANANEAVENIAIAQPADKDGNPIDDPNAPKIPCVPCETQNPLISIETSKSSDIGNGNPAQAGQIITYSLTTLVSGGTTTQPILLTDQLGNNLQFVVVKDAGSFITDTSQAPKLNFTLPKATAVGTYEIIYQAKIKDGVNVGVADNKVTANHGICEPCTTENPLVGVNTSKVSDYDNNQSVQQGDVITYSLTTTISGGNTTLDTNLTDILGEGLNFVSVINAGNFITDTSQAPTLKFTLPAGKTPGTYNILYNVKVSNKAAAKVINKVTADNGSCSPCETENPLANVRAEKSSNIGNGTPVQIGDVITYTLTLNVENGKTTQSVLLTDTLGESIDFIKITNVGDFTFIGSDDKKQLKFLLPEGKEPGIYKLSYAVRVRTDTAVPAKNTAQAQAADSNGNPITGEDAPVIPCEPCETENPLNTVYIRKSSDKIDATGNPMSVQPGDIVTYKLEAIVSNGVTSRPILLTDILNDSLEFVAVKNSGPFKTDTSAAPVLHFTLPKDTAPGTTYALTYEARVKKTATTDIANTVIAQATDDAGNPITGEDAPIIPCNPCATANPLVGISVIKSSNIGNDTYVQLGDIIGYKLKVSIKGGASSKNIKLNDTTNNSLEYVGTVDCSSVFTSPQTFAEKRALLMRPISKSFVRGIQTSTISVPSGTPAGDHEYCYQARVTKDAKITAKNSVVPQYVDDKGNPIDDPNTPPIPCEPCDTQNPLSALKVSKTANIPNGTPVRQGDIITYKLTVEIGAGKLLQRLHLIDLPNDNLEFIGLVPDENPSITYDPESTLSQLKFIGYEGLVNGTYSISYQAKVKPQATGKIENGASAFTEVIQQQYNRKNNRILQLEKALETTEVPCDPCKITNPIKVDISIRKKLVAESGTVPGMAEPGETLTYEITIENNGGEKTDYAVQDILDANVAYLESDNGGKHDGAVKGGTVEWTGLTVPAGDDNQSGILQLTVKTKVSTPIDEKSQDVFNMVKEKGAPDPDCARRAAHIHALAEDNQCVAIALAKPKLRFQKTIAFIDANGNGVADADDILRYNFTLINEGNIAIEDAAVTDPGPRFNNHPAINKLGEFKPEKVSLAATEQKSITADYILDAADIENSAGLPDSVINKANAKGYTPGGSGDPDYAVISNDDEAKFSMTLPKSDISIGKTVSIRAIRRGEQAPYTIRISNNGTKPVQNIRVIDTAPAGFRYVENSASADGHAVKPSLAGRNVIFENINLAPKQTAEIHLNMMALSTATPGEYTNRAYAEDEQGNRLTNIAKAIVEVLVEHVFDCSDVIGTVFDDYNRNGSQDEGELGLPNVRLITAKGWIITTDTFGRFHIPCAALPDSRTGSNFILKLDSRSLPSGYRLTTENPRIVRLTAGKLSKINFGASISRVVRLDLRSEAFEPNQITLKTEWNSGIHELIYVLQKEQAVLRLSYLAEQKEAKLANARINAIENLIRKFWTQKQGRYRLEIETHLEAG